MKVLFHHSGYLGTTLAHVALMSCDFACMVDDTQMARLSAKMCALSISDDLQISFSQTGQWLSGGPRKKGNVRCRLLLDAGVLKCA